MTVERWLAAAEADADARGLPELKPLLQGLAASTRALRAGDWNDVADDGPPAPAPARRRRSDGLERRDHRRAARRAGAPAPPPPSS